MNIFSKLLGSDKIETIKKIWDSNNTSNHTEEQKELNTLIQKTLEQISKMKKTIEPDLLECSMYMRNKEDRKWRKLCLEILDRDLPSFFVKFKEVVDELMVFSIKYKVDKPVWRLYERLDNLSYLYSSINNHKRNRDECLIKLRNLNGRISSITIILDDIIIEIQKQIRNLDENR